MPKSQYPQAVVVGTDSAWVSLRSVSATASNIDWSTKHYNMQKSTMESASWQRPLYGFEISQNQAKISLKSGFSDGLGG